MELKGGQGSRIKRRGERFVAKKVINCGQGKPVAGGGQQKADPEVGFVGKVP